VSAEDFDVFVDIAELAFPCLWKPLCNVRDIKGRRDKNAKELEKAKKRKVLLQIFALRRMRNPSTLKWWALIQSIAYYGWGVGCTALDASTYWGHVCRS